MASELLPRGVVTRANRFRDIAGRSFSISTRSASFFRMYIGVVLIANTVGRADLLTYFYTSRGVFPGTVVGFQNPNWTWPVLFAVLVFLAGVYTIGYHARFTAIWIWILLLLVHQRNPLVLQAGDYLLRYSILFQLSFRWTGTIRFGIYTGVMGSIDQQIS
jgi:hypothetical protein